MKKKRKESWLTPENIGARGYDLIRFAEFAFIGILGLHFGTQVNHCANTIADMASPPEIRKEFQEEFGFPLRGWKEDIEEEPSGLSRLAAIVNREKIVRPFELASMRIRSESYFKKSFPEQMKHLFSELEIGFYWFDNIALDSCCCSNSLIHHEIKHAKVDELIKEHPDFRQRWAELAKDEKRNSLYVGSDWRGLDYKESKKLGFVSNYSRKNADEDIAMLCEAAETYPRHFEDWLYGKRRNLKIVERVKLAQEVKLIPPEFSEYVLLQRKRRESYKYSLFVKDHQKAEEFLEESGRFLEEYPETTYQSELRRARGEVFEDMSPLMIEDDLWKAVTEYELALISPYKDIAAYPKALERLADCYESLRNAKKSSIYKEAEDEYWRRFNEGSVRLTMDGVNDFLEERL